MFIVYKGVIVLNLYAILLAYQYVIITLVLAKWLRILKFDVNELQNLHVTFTLRLKTYSAIYLTN